MLIKEGLVKDSYDYTDWGNNSSLIYDSVVVGESASMVKFSQHCSTNISNVEYSKLQLGGGDCFGCVSLRKKQYCILNKQYTKEKYFELRDKIIKHMTDMPYVDYIGRSYVYGEFFPMEISPHAYNNSFAGYLYPLEKNEIKKGLKWHDQYFNEYSITMDYSELPDNIKETDEKILKEIIKCSTCPRGYKIVKQELDLCKKLNIPISRQCPFCRIDEKIKVWVSNMKQILRSCEKCGLEFKTHRSIEESPKMYCEGCYKQEVY
jgi:Zn ribbon nucleic-acid-binding protein